MPFSKHQIDPAHIEAMRSAFHKAVVTELRHDGTMAAASSRGDTAITIEISGAVVRAASGVDPAWLRDVLRAVKAAT